MRKNIFILLGLLFIFNLAFSQDAKISVEVPNVVRVGETFQLTYAINASPNSIEAPAFSDISVVGGPSTASSSSMQIMNGRMSQTVEYSYTYYCQIAKQGKFNVPILKATIKGKTYSSTPTVIEAVGQSANTNGGNGTPNEAGAKGAETGNLFVRVILDKNNVYQGEAIVATIKIYAKVNLANISDMKIPDFAGYFKQDIETPQLTSLQRENYNGEIYNTGVLQQFLLIPQRSGELLITPVEIGCIVREVSQRQSRGFFDEMFNSYRDVPVKISSKQLKVTVKPLPDNKPDGFNGAVGQFDFKASIDKQKVTENNPISLKVKINGKGNLKLIDAPKIKFPSDFEAYDPEIKTDEIKSNISGMSGTKTYEYLVIPRHSGTFTIPPIEFSYFDPATKKYVTKKSDAYTIEVEKGIGNDQTVGTTTISYNQKDIKLLGKDIRFINTDATHLIQKKRFVITHPMFYIFMLLVLTSFVLFIILKRKQIQENSDLSKSKNRKANKTALKRLKLAEQKMKESHRDKFYEEIIKAIWGYLSDKLMISTADLSKSLIVTSLENKSVTKDDIQQLMKVIDECEIARYSPISQDNEPEKIYNDTIQVITKLEQTIK